MTGKAVRWIAVIATIAALAAPAIFAVDKQSGASVGVPPQTVADYLRAVIMAHRHFYTIHIANRLSQERVVGVSEDWQATHSLPLPVQLLRETSEIAELTGPDVRYRLISDSPINKANAAVTEFERRGLKEVQLNPNKPYARTTREGGKQVFEAIYADVAVTASCVECHNAHPKSPKTDFKTGDVMGGLVISFPLRNR